MQSLISRAILLADMVLVCGAITVGRPVLLEALSMGLS